MGDANDKTAALPMVYKHRVNAKNFHWQISLNGFMGHATFLREKMTLFQLTHRWHDYLHIFGSCVGAMPNIKVERSLHFIDGKLVAADKCYCCLQADHTTQLWNRWSVSMQGLLEFGCPLIWEIGFVVPRKGSMNILINLTLLKYRSTTYHKLCRP